ncbi:rab-like protein 2A isoform X1 [Procambarus clarkii]|uniref:rab-like protein 2A isoform X1 n=1 Tax=Procambarus clarkii TaxID=6728 RepID=UPI001E6763B6|nr:rab-like protein 2A isoform X1 [Procambarus clarkii]
MSEETCEKDAQGENTQLDYDKNTSKGELAVKVICLGDSAVGKSKLVERFLMDGYQHQQLSTFALTLYRYRTKVENTDVLVDFWDTAGQERFQTMHPSYYHQVNGIYIFQAHAAILVFDGTRKVTYKNLSNWYKELRQHRPEIPCFCAVNKIDENEDIAGKSFAFPEKNNIPMYYVSASSGTNVVKMFKDAINAAFQYKKNPTDVTDQIMEELEMDMNL